MTYGDVLEKIRALCNAPYDKGHIVDAISRLIDEVSGQPEADKKPLENKGVKMAMKGPFEHISHNGTRFSALTTKLSSVSVFKPKGISLEQYTADVSEMIGYHAINVWPELYSEGFQGYDAIIFSIVEVE